MSKTKREKRYSLAMIILNLCGVKDLKHIIRIKIIITVKSFNIIVIRNSTDKNGEFIISDNAVVTQTNTYRI